MSKKWKILRVGCVIRHDGPDGNLYIQFPGWTMEDPDAERMVTPLGGEPRARMLDTGGYGEARTTDPSAATDLWEKATIGGYTFSELQAIARDQGAET